MSDPEEEENFCFFGKPLEPYDEDAFPKKKPISVEDQVARDAQGRRRFHGAFTGGFSAGFFNTVGSLEGWTPTEFKSTRQDKASSKAQKPEDFMDDEDLGQFGIAPQTVRATSDYSTSKKRKRQVFSDGPIPGEPVLHSLLTSGNETIGYLLLKNIGLKGKNKEPERTSSEDKIYGCQMPKTYEISREDDVVVQYTIHEIYKEYFEKPKDNSFGLGYVGLDKTHINLFKSTKLVINEKNKKKVSISGQAFGVGAFEDDDEDIYVKDDMNRYDFELTGEKASKKETTAKSLRIFDDFIASKNPLPPKEQFLPPTIPHSFTGKHKVKRSRFEPLPSESAPIPERKEMNPEIRGKYLGEENISTPPPAPTEKIEESTPTTQEVKTENSESTNKFDLFSVAATDLLFDRFVSASKPEDPSNILEVIQPSETTHGTQEMKDAARMKMFGPLTRISTDWQPCSLLCKRFNVPEPHMDELNANKNRKRTKNLIFEYEKFADVSADFKPGLSVTQQENNNAESVESEIGNITEGTAEEPRQDEPPANTETEKAPNDEPLTKDITERIEVDKNIDLFKAVFLSSSESEDEEENKEEEKINKNIEMKNTILSDTLLPKIKPMKEGILSNMDFSIFQNPHQEKTPEKKSDDMEVQEEPNNDLSYGPNLPASLPKSSVTTHKSYKDFDDTDEWVEKTDKSRKHKKDKKKHKNKKSSHKKKHKHSKD